MSTPKTRSDRNDAKLPPADMVLRLTAICGLLFLQANMTPLHLAAKQGCEQIVTMLLDAGADRTLTNKVSSQPFKSSMS